MATNVLWLCLVAENTRLTLNLKLMSKSTKSISNQAENGNKSKPLLYDGIFVGQKVIDEDGDKGEITRIENIYNIYVKYDNGGSGISCLNGCCNDRLYAII
jgi:hypothetical protein